jgi:hypothetical protein
MCGIRHVALVVVSVVCLMGGTAHAGDDVERLRALDEAWADLSDAAVAALRGAAGVYTDAGLATPDSQPERRECLFAYARYFDCVGAQNAEYVCERPKWLDCRTSEGAKTDPHAIAETKYAQFFRAKAARLPDEANTQRTCYEAIADYHSCRAETVASGEGLDSCAHVTAGACGDEK